MQIYLNSNGHGQRKRYSHSHGMYMCVCVFLSVARHAVFYPQCLQMCPVGLQCRVAVGFRSALTEFVVCDLIFLNVQYGHSDVDVVFRWVLSYWQKM